MKTLSKFGTLLLVVIMVLSCQEYDDPDKNQATGFLKLGLTLDIEKLPAGGRTAAVNTDNFKVTIFKANGTVHMIFDPFSTAPEEIELETGEYYIEAHSNDLVNAAFDSPYYFGVSDNFTIDKEELKTINIECTMANFKISFVYSENIQENFSDWNARVTLSELGDFLEWPKTETREGYFITSPVDIEVELTYQKQFSDDVIVKTLNASIDNPEPRTHYRINVDAVLENGRIVININVDEGVDVIDIDLSLDETDPLIGPVGFSVLPGGATFASSGVSAIQGTRIWDFSNVALANSQPVYWGVGPDEIKASMNGNIYDDVLLNEVLDFMPGESDLEIGLLIWRGTTRVPNGTSVQTKFTLNIVDNLTGVPLELINPVTVGLPASVGGVAKFLNSSHQIEVSFSLTASAGGPFDTYKSIYDSNTGLGEGNQAFSSILAGFYY